MVWARWRRHRGRGGGDRAGSRAQRGMNPAGPDRAGAAPVGSPAWLAGLRPIPAGSSGGTAFDLRGTDANGGVLRVAVSREQAWLLLCFLAPDCTGCEEVWENLTVDPLVVGGRRLRSVVIVREDAARRARVAQLAVRVAPIPVVASDAAWSDYKVLGYPELVVVDGTRSLVVARTTVFTWEDALRRLEHELAEGAGSGASGAASY